MDKKKMFFLVSIIASSILLMGCNEDSANSADASVGNGEGTGGETGADTGEGTGGETGADTGEGTGGETGADTGEGTGGETGADTGEGTGGTTGEGEVGVVADHGAADNFDSIAAATIAQVQNLNVAYWHTSHGSQLVSGVNYLGAEYALPNLHDNGGPDLGSSTWDTITSTYLDLHPETDVVIWSWCGQVSTDIEMSSHYLDKMAALEIAYPDVVFIYMTGHLRGAYSEYLYEDTQNERVQSHNGEIRSHCATNNSWLFDFADIESYLDGSSDQCMYNAMPVECLWPEEPTFGCAHSRGPNCVRKEKLFGGFSLELAVGMAHSS